MFIIEVILDIVHVHLYIVCTCIVNQNHPNLEVIVNVNRLYMYDDYISIVTKSPKESQNVNI